MRVWPIGRAQLTLAVALGALVVTSSAGCGGRLGRQFEYEEDMTVALDGSATINVNASLVALVALRGVDLDTRPNARFDPSKVRAIFTSPVTRVIRVSNSRQHGRRFAYVRIVTDDIRRLATAAPFAWSTYHLEPTTTDVAYRQVVGPSANRAVENTGWTGREIVAFRLHLPSKIRYHNAPSKTVERGNILGWEQLLADRRAGVPITLEVIMEPTSILYRTLWLFGISGLTAMVVMAAIIWWVVRRGEKPAAPGS
jgi:hypothetical protein